MITIRSAAARAALGTLLFAGGCAQLRAANASPPMPMEGQLTETLRQADQAAQQSRFGVADRLLAEFAERFPNTPEAVEAGFWRALFDLDPSNATAAPADALSLLDTYLAAPVTVTHRAAATALRHIAVALDHPPTVVTNAQASPRAELKIDAKSDQSRDDEIQKLKSDLAKANAELERIKRRLAQPNP